MCVDLIKIRLGDFVCETESDPQAALGLSSSGCSLVLFLKCQLLKWLMVSLNCIVRKERNLNVNELTEVCKRSRHQSQKQRFRDWIRFQLFLNAGKPKPSLQIYVFSGLQHLRPPCRRYFFQQNAYQNEKLWFEMQRNKGLMYCFVEAGWEIFSLSFAAQVISLAFSGSFFGLFAGSGIPLPVQEKTFTFYKLCYSVRWGGVSEVLGPKYPKAPKICKIPRK